MMSLFVNAYMSGRPYGSVANAVALGAVPWKPCTIECGGVTELLLTILFIYAYLLNNFSICL